jgi:hypothetical protein
MDKVTQPPAVPPAPPVHAPLPDASWDPVRAAIFAAAREKMERRQSLPPAR